MQEPTQERSLFGRGEVGLGGGLGREGAGVRVGAGCSGGGGGVDPSVTSDQPILLLPVTGNHPIIHVNGFHQIASITGKW